jgi:hypothetical protein
MERLADKWIMIGTWLIVAAGVAFSAAPVFV